MSDVLSVVAGSVMPATLADLAELMGTDAGTPRYLELMAEAAAAVVAGAASASVSLCQDGAVLVTAASGEAARRLDEKQFSAGRGPGVEAVLDGREVQAVLDGREVALGDPPPGRWPEFAAAAAGHGIGSSLAVPMATAAHRGVVSIYGSSTGLFADPAVRDTARNVARCFAAVLSASDRCSQASAQCAQLRQALESRAVIEQAKGMIMAQARCTADHAFSVLARASKRHHVKLRDLAASVVAGGSVPGCLKPARRDTGWARLKHPRRPLRCCGIRRRPEFA